MAFLWPNEALTVSLVLLLLLFTSSCTETHRVTYFWSSESLSLLAQHSLPLSTGTLCVVPGGSATELRTYLQETAGCDE